jgi:lipopolysaccharide export system permease protein
MNLDDVFFHSIDITEQNQFEYVSSPSMIYNILLQDITFTIRNPGPREMSSTDVASLIDELEESRQNKIADIKEQMNERAFDYLQQYQYLVYAFMEDKTVYAGKSKNLERVFADYQELAKRDITDRRLQITKIEYYKKFSIPAACLAFVFFAFPVGLLTRKSGRAVGFGLGLLMSIFYWGLLVAGQSIGIQRPDFPPFLAMWLPNFIILGLGLLFFIVRIRR